MKVKITKIKGYDFEGYTPEDIKIKGGFSVNWEHKCAYVTIDYIYALNGYNVPLQLVDLDDIAEQIEMSGLQAEWLADHEASQIDYYYDTWSGK